MNPLKSTVVFGIWIAFTRAQSISQITVPASPVGSAPPLPYGTPMEPPAYMKDNVNNYFGTAPDKGSLTGPVLDALDSTGLLSNNLSSSLMARANTDDYWLSSLGSAGKMPLAPSGYQFFRNVKDFGAVGDGKTDDTAAINRAAATYGLSNLNTLRCGKGCGSTTVLGAVVYFPPGTYLISTPIIQYYYTQFVGNPNNMPTIKGALKFKGIALFDSDFYIPGGNGSEWYINQSNFYRQIRNFNFDMTAMNATNTDNGQTYWPTGIHWQIGQATSITNCNFKMSVSTASQSATGVGIFMENGSGGVASDLTFFGGQIGFFAGSQQFTASNLQFTSCLTAVKHVFNWGFNWKNIYVLSCYIAFDCTAYSGITQQGTGSIAVVDSHFNGVPYAITLAQLGTEQPNIVLDNLLVENSQSIVLISGGATLLPGSTGAEYITSWASGFQYFPNGSGGKRAGFVDPTPNKTPELLDSNGAYFRRMKPQYAGSSPVVATDHSVANDGTGDQTGAINSLLSSNIGSVIFFPAGIYQVQGTVHVPVGSLIIGSGWSQIMATGSYFSDAAKPAVVVQVGNKGDKGIIEISDMLFTVKGGTAGAILMEWNVYQGSQGSAAMWDSHFRVGGAQGSNLQTTQCPAGSSPTAGCMAASMLLHVTNSASGYFDNVWAWVADHDLDNKANADAYESDHGIPLNVKTDISIYAARGMLIESQGPSWFYGTASEHAQLYQYQLFNAANIYMGHMQTETPYYQPKPNALSPYKPGGTLFPSDPTFHDCSDDLCRTAWPLRVLNSTNVFIYAAGFYSFFQSYTLGCAESNSCQLSMIETNYVQGLWLYNVFTKGDIEIISPNGGVQALLHNSTTSDGYTSEIACWLALSTGGGDLGETEGSGDGVVTLDPVIWSSPTVTCSPPCTYVFPPLTLSTPTTFVYPPLTTTLTVGYYSTTTETWYSSVMPESVWISSVDTTTITVPPVTTTVVSFWDITVTDNSTVLYPSPSIVAPPFNITEPTSYSGTKVAKSTRTFWPPPWTTQAPPFPPSTSYTPGKTSGERTKNDGHRTVTHIVGPPHPICTHVTGCGHHCGSDPLDICTPCWFDCGGPPAFNGPDPFGPDPPFGVPVDPVPSNGECSTTTYTSCDTLCPSATTSCSTTCRENVGCETSTGTLSACDYATPILYTPPNPNALPASMGGGGLDGFTLFAGPPPVTSMSSRPPTATKSGTATCIQTTAPTNTPFYLWWQSSVGCEVVGMTQVCTPPQIYQSTCTIDGFNCNNLGNCPYEGEEYRTEVMPQPANFTVQGWQQCDKQNLYFTQQCDGSYFAVLQDYKTGAQLPGTAVCYKPGQNGAQGKTIGCTYGDLHGFATTELICYGDICFE